MKRLGTILKGAGIFLLLLGIWQLACSAEIWSTYVLPPPRRVAETLLKMLRRGDLLAHVAISLRRVGIGFTISFLLSFGFGLLRALVPRLTPYYNSLLNAVRHIPPLSLVPLFILWFGIGELPKIIVIVLASFFPMLLNTNAGLSGCDPRLLEVGTTLGFSKPKLFFRILLPNAVPDILVGLRLGLGNSLRAIVGAEMIAASSGLGYLILDAQAMSRTDKVIVGVLLIGVIGLAIDLLFRWLIRLVSHGTKEVSE